MADGETNQRCEQCGEIHPASQGVIERLREKRDWCIKEAEKLTRILDYFDQHADVQEFARLFDELREEDQAQTNASCD